MTKLDTQKLDTSKTEWDLSPLLKNDDDPNIKKFRDEIMNSAQAFEEKWRNRDDYLKDPATLKEAMDEMNAMEELNAIGKEEFYFGLRSAQDTISTDLRAKTNLADEFGKEVNNHIRFFMLNVGKIAPEEQAKFLNDEGLRSYKHILDRLFANSKYLLSEPEEKIMALKATPAYSQWVQMTDNFLSKETRESLKEDSTKAQLTMEELQTLTTSPNREVRDSAGKALDQLYADYAEIAEAEVNAILINKKIDDDLRGYSRPDQHRHIRDDIDADVVDALLNAVSGKYQMAVRFMDLKAKLLKQDTFKYHERNLLPESKDSEFAYDAAVGLVHKVFSGLDSEGDFPSILKYMVEGGQIDVYPRKGKTGGAFCAGHLIQNPTYVMLNFTNKLRDVTTLAHEMGHAINNELIKHDQNAMNYGTPTSTAEVASTFMEDFVMEELLEKADAETELALRLEVLQGDIASVFRQVACYRFEQDLHRIFREKGYISKDEINEIFTKHMQDYLGRHAEGAENWWVYWSHFRQFFYVYSYASGTLISKGLQAKVREDKKFINKVKQFLGTGLSKSPKEIFNEMGIDITDKAFWNAGLGEIERRLDETEALAKKLGKID
jgi:oligoendopeptidase F